MIYEQFKIAKLFTVVLAKTVYIFLYYHTDFDPQIIYFQKNELYADKINLRNLRWSILDLGCALKPNDCYPYEIKKGKFEAGKTEKDAM